jgi:hypothetical protein
MAITGMLSGCSPALVEPTAQPDVPVDPTANDGMIYCGTAIYDNPININPCLHADLGVVFDEYHNPNQNAYIVQNRPVDYTLHNDMGIATYSGHYPVEFCTESNKFTVHFNLHGEAPVSGAISWLANVAIPGNQCVLIKTHISGDFSIDDREHAQANRFVGALALMGDTEHQTAIGPLLHGDYEYMFPLWIETGGMWLIGPTIGSLHAVNIGQATIHSIGIELVNDDYCDGVR